MRGRRFRRGGRCRRRRRRLIKIKIHFRRLPCSLIRLEIRIIPRKSRKSRHQTIREQRNVRVVTLNRFVVPPPLHRNPVFRSRQLILQPQKILIRFQLRIILHHHQQAAQRRIQLPVRRDLVRRSLRPYQRRARRRDIPEHLLLLHRKSLHRLHQVGNQICPPLQDHIHLRPRRVHGLLFHRHLIPPAHIHASQRQRQNQQHRQNYDCRFHSHLVRLSCKNLP